MKSSLNFSDFWSAITFERTCKITVEAELWWCWVLETWLYVQYSCTRTGEIPELLPRCDPGEQVNFGQCELQIQFPTPGICPEGWWFQEEWGDSESSPSHLRSSWAGKPQQSLQLQLNSIFTSSFSNFLAAHFRTRLRNNVLNFPLCFSASH